MGMPPFVESEIRNPKKKMRPAVWIPPTQPVSRSARQRASRLMASELRSNMHPSPPRASFVVLRLPQRFLALLAGATGFLVRLPFPGPQLIFLALFVATLVAATAVPALRAWVDALPLGTLVGINALRFIGITFLVLAARGQIAPVFAARAGWGDIPTAVLALVLLAAGEPRTPLHPGLAHAWNVFGLLDLVVAVGTATAVTLDDTAPGIAPVLDPPLGV